VAQWTLASEPMATATTEPGSPKPSNQAEHRAALRSRRRQLGDAPADGRRRRDQPRSRARGGGLLGLGLGWNVSFVAATAELSERTERASLLGFNDLVSGATGAGLTLLGGVALTAGGVALLAIGAVVLVTIPAVWILRRGDTPCSSKQRPREATVHPQLTVILANQRAADIRRCAELSRLARSADLRSSPVFRHRHRGTARVPRLLARGRLSLEATR
jgi:hypothetical protein